MLPRVLCETARASRMPLVIAIIDRSWGSIAWRETLADIRLILFICMYRVPPRELECSILQGLAIFVSLARNRKEKKRAEFLRVLVPGHTGPRCVSSRAGTGGRRNALDASCQVEKRSPYRYFEMRGKKNPRWELRGMFVGVRGKKWAAAPYEDRSPFVSVFDNTGRTGVVDADSSSALGNSSPS